MTSILFGAGAEQPLGLDGGGKFAQAVLGIDVPNIDRALDDYYKKVLKEISDPWYPKYNHKKWTNNDLLRASIRKKYLENSTDTHENYEKLVNSEFESIKDKEAKKNEIVNLYPSYIGLLDGCFHVLMNPNVLGANKFWRVVLCYSRAYCYLLGRMKGGDVSIEDYYSFLSDPSSAVSLMRKWAANKRNEKNYYSILRQFSRVKIVTTNYTEASNILAEKNIDEVAFIHGKFGWFESAKYLSIYDVDRVALPNDIMFPFVSIQSGIKPIVQEKQIKEYSKMIRYFEESEKIIILGYRFNTDDNHINGILRSFLMEGKHMVYFDVDNTGRESILKRLRVYNEKQSNFEYISTNKERCMDEFEKCLSSDN